MGDEDWLMQKHGCFMSDGGLEGFSERVGLKIDSGVDLEAAREEAFEEYAKKKMIFKTYKAFK